MNIDRHNYEEYFLLYVDNELTVDQKRQVELFARVNPDLEEELVMLQQSKLIPDESIVFNQKHLLMKEVSGSFINMNNYEEWLVLYVDDELTQAQRVIVDKFAADHPNVQHELGLFQQAKLEPETTIFADKEVLYRTEKPKVVIMQWWRVAVAAVLVLGAGIILYSISHTSSNPGTTTATRESVASKKEQPATRPQTLPANPQESVQNDQKNTQQVAATSPTTRSRTQQKQPLKNVNAKQPGQEVPLPLAQQTIAAVPKEKETAENAMVDKISEPRINDALTTGGKKVDIDLNKTVTQGPVQTPNTVEVASNTENKRFRGLFRKASRLIERTANINPTDDDNRVLIGGMAINLK